MPSSISEHRSSHIKVYDGDRKTADKQYICVNLNISMSNMDPQQGNANQGHCMLNEMPTIDDKCH